MTLIKAVIRSTLRSCVKFFHFLSNIPHKSVITITIQVSCKNKKKRHLRLIYMEKKNILRENTVDKMVIITYFNRLLSIKQTDKSKAGETVLKIQTLENSSFSPLCVHVFPPAILIDQNSIAIRATNSQSRCSKPCVYEARVLNLIAGAPFSSSQLDRVR